MLQSRFAALTALCLSALEVEGQGAFMPAPRTPTRCTGWASIDVLQIDRKTAGGSFNHAGHVYQSIAAARTESERSTPDWKTSVPVSMGTAYAYHKAQSADGKWRQVSVSTAKRCYGPLGSGPFVDDRVADTAREEAAARAREEAAARARARAEEARAREEAAARAEKRYDTKDGEGPFTYREFAAYYGSDARTEWEAAIRPDERRYDGAYGPYLFEQFVVYYRTEGKKAALDAWVASGKPSSSARSVAARGVEGVVTKVYKGGVQQAAVELESQFPGYSGKFGVMINGNPGLPAGDKGNQWLGNKLMKPLRRPIRTPEEWFENLNRLEGGQEEGVLSNAFKTEELTPGRYEDAKRAALKWMNWAFSKWGLVESPKDGSLATPPPAGASRNGYVATVQKMDYVNAGLNGVKEASFGHAFANSELTFQLSYEDGATSKRVVPVVAFGPQCSKKQGGDLRKSQQRTTSWRCAEGEFSHTVDRYTEEKFGGASQKEASFFANVRLDKVRRSGFANADGFTPTRDSRMQFQRDGVKDALRAALDTMISQDIRVALLGLVGIGLYATHWQRSDLCKAAGVSNVGDLIKSYTNDILFNETAGTYSAPHTADVPAAPKLRDEYRTKKRAAFFDHVEIPGFGESGFAAC